MEEDMHIRNWVLTNWPHARAETKPFEHWLPQYALPAGAAHALATLKVQAPRIGDTAGKRETHNASRWFFSPQHRSTMSACSSLANAFQHPSVVTMLQSLTGAELSGSSLRIEYCQDTAGFWLEPHTDIGAKRIIVLIYLTDTPEARSLGTDLYDSEKRYLGHAPGDFNSGLIFVPGAGTWHGFRKRPFAGVRTSLIINYVGPEWRASHELSFPGSPVAASV